jgi:uncharacterized protein (TIGR02646 family)
MIKLELASKPKQLTTDFQKKQTDKFKADNSKSVWDFPWLKAAILDMSYGKCCYSEVLLNENSNYMEVEHFVSKKVDSDLVMEWGNLLPSCKKCNTTKGEHDTLSKPIVNPFRDNPKEFFYIKNYRFYPKEEKKEIADRTIDVVGLNDRAHFVRPRFEAGSKVLDTISFLFDHKEDVLNGKTRPYLRKLSEIMKQGARTEAYAALISTLILTDPNYIAIETFLRAHALWNNELEALKAELEFCALPE